jgi:pyruvate,orthophosphate dikinase
LTIIIRRRYRIRSLCARRSRRRGQAHEDGLRAGPLGTPDIKLGICGEHGGDPSSIEFCHKLGLNYVSCSPFRVPIARLAAAQATIKEKRGEL